MHQSVNKRLNGRKLMIAAQRHAQDQADNNKMSHAGSNGSSLKQRIDAVDFDWNMIGENVARGYKSVQEVMEGWLKSQGHRENILNSGFKHFGVGEANRFWTQYFGNGASELCQGVSAAVTTWPTIATTTCSTAQSTRSMVYQTVTRKYEPTRTRRYRRRKGYQNK